MNNVVRTTGIPIAPLHDWLPGDPLRAAHLDPPNRTIEAMLGAQSVAQEVLYPPLSPGGTGNTEKFKVITANPGAQYAMKGEYYFATRLSTGEEHIKIAKPWMLRRSTWVGRIQYLNEFRMSVEYLSVGSDIHTRRRVRQVELPFISQLQMIWPEYASNDIINAQQLGEEGTGVEGVEWEDMNETGRVWSVLPLGLLE